MNDVGGLECTMCRTQCVLSLLALYVGLAHSFSWDIALMKNFDNNGVDFYDNETKTHSEERLTKDRVHLITYDPVHNRVLFTVNKYDYVTFVYSFDIATKKLQHLVSSSKYGYFVTFTYDPITETLFWVQSRKSLYWFSLKPGSKNEVNGNYLMETDGVMSKEIAVDSCGGYIYWIYEHMSIMRARFHGNEKEVLIDGHQNVNNFLSGLTIDQQTQKIYWIINDFDTDPSNYTFSVQSADLNGKNARTLFETKTTNVLTLLAVSKDFIYWGSKRRGKDIKSLWRLQKNPPHDRVASPKEIITTAYSYMAIATNYKTEDQIKGIQNCEALKSLRPINSDNDYLNVSTDASLLCVHGTKVSGESLCECAQGYAGERCDVPFCQNYCFRGYCSVNIEGQPECRCYAGYSGKMCEVIGCTGDCLDNGVCWSRHYLSSALIISVLSFHRFIL